MKWLAIALLFGVWGCSKASSPDYGAIGPDEGGRASDAATANAGGDGGVVAIGGDDGGPGDEVVEVECDGGSGFVEVSFPGHPERDLERVRVATHIKLDAGLPGVPPGYEWSAGGGAYVRDGVVAMPCSPFYAGMRVTLPAR